LSEICLASASIPLIGTKKVRARQGDRRHSKLAKKKNSICVSRRVYSVKALVLNIAIFSHRDSFSTMALVISTSLLVLCITALLHINSYGRLVLSS